MVVHRVSTTQQAKHGSTCVVKVVKATKSLYLLEKWNSLHLKQYTLNFKLLQQMLTIYSVLYLWGPRYVLQSSDGLQIVDTRTSNGEVLCIC